MIFRKSDHAKDIHLVNIDLSKTGKEIYKVKTVSMEQEIHSQINSNKFM